MKLYKPCYDETRWMVAACPLLRRLLYTQDTIYDVFREKLDDHKVARDDVPMYTTKLIQRQQLVNETLISWWTDNLSNKLVLDACCWPEWSSLAVFKRGWQRRGNEISKKTYEYLKKLWLDVTNGKVENLPFSSSLFDYVVYCYAINNIQATPRVFQESLRVLKKWGNILVADPGISYWISCLVLNSLKDHFPTDLLWIKEKIVTQKKFNTNIPNYFESKNISCDEYTDVILSWLLWLNREMFLLELPHFLEYVRNRYPDKELQSTSADRLLHVFHHYINAFYRENIITTSRISWSKLESAWLISCFKTIGDPDRWVTESISLDINNLSTYNLREFFMNLQKTKNSTTKIGEKWLEKLIPTILLKFIKD